MPDTGALTRSSGASRRQVELWRHQGLLHASIAHGRAEYPDQEILVARALYRLSALGVMPGGRLANDIIEAIRTEVTKTRLLRVGHFNVDLVGLTKPTKNGQS